MPAPPLQPAWLAPPWRIRLAQAFLVLLRLAIGWHLFVQGMDKIVSVQLGPTESNQPWTSRGYLQEAQGPLGPWFRQLAGDPEQLDQDYLRLPLSDDFKTELLTVPMKLRQHWEQYVKKLTAQQRIAETKPLGQLLNELKEWQIRQFVRERRPFVKQFPSGPVTVELSQAEQIQYYQSLRQELRNLLDKEFTAFGATQRRQRWQDLRTEIQRQRGVLLREQAEASQELEDSCKNVCGQLLPAVQVATLRANLASPFGQLGPVLARLSMTACPTIPMTTDPVRDKPLQDAIPRAAEPSRLLAWADATMRWGLFLAGLGLLLGLLTPAACSIGAILLLLIFLAQPPLPWLPVPQTTPGFTPYLNATLIEAVALVALAFVPTGRWLGLDALGILGARWLVSRRGEPATVSETADGATPRKAIGTGKYRRYTGA